MSTATLTRLVERDTRLAGHVDRQSGVIRGVRILGKHSKNGRVSPENAMRDAVKLYDGKKVFLDHDRSGKERGFSAVGVLENVRMERDSVGGDLRLFKSHQRFSYIVERAELDPNNFGLSHEADGHTTPHPDPPVNEQDTSPMPTRAVHVTVGLGAGVVGLVEHWAWQASTRGVWR